MGLIMGLRLAVYGKIMLQQGEVFPATAIVYLTNVGISIGNYPQILFSSFSKKSISINCALFTNAGSREAKLP